MRRNRKTKIVATLGPASQSEEMIERLFLAGVDVFRLNFSHGSHDDHAASIERIRRIEARHERPIGIMADMQGPKFRLGVFEDGSIPVKPDQVLRLDLDKTPGNAERVNLPHPEIIDALDIGARILFDDGRVSALVQDKGEDWLEIKITAGQVLSNRKGVNIPGTVLPMSPITDKDRKDMAFALKQGVDWIALSFVQKGDDLAEARKLIGREAGLIAKIEKPSAVDNLDELITLADALMLARGDLGVELAAEEVPGLQKSVIRRTRDEGKPIIVATQMLESMVNSPAPTRAEASDVATAVFDGTDAIMLSAETAAGDYPVESVSMMDRIAKSVEADPLYRPIVDAEHPEPRTTTSDAITVAANSVADTISAAAIVTYTTSGSTTLRAARERPNVPVICLTSELDTARHMTLSYGVHAVHTEDVNSFQEMVDKASEMAMRDGLADTGQRIVVTAGVPFGTPGNTNILRVAWIER